VDMFINWVVMPLSGLLILLALWIKKSGVQEILKDNEGILTDYLELSDELTSLSNARVIYLRTLGQTYDLRKSDTQLFLARLLLMTLYENTDVVGYLWYLRHRTQAPKAERQMLELHLTADEAGLYADQALANWRILSDVQNPSSEFHSELLQKMDAIDMSALRISWKKLTQPLESVESLMELEGSVADVLDDLRRTKMVCEHRTDMLEIILHAKTLTQDDRAKLLKPPSVTGIMGESD